MRLIAQLLLAVIALAHLWFLTLEMCLWTKGGSDFPALNEFGEGAGFSRSRRELENLQRVSRGRSYVRVSAD
jgi:hypothetical protein